MKHQRKIMPLLLMMAALTVLSGCASNKDTDSVSESNSDSETVSIETKFGTIEINGTPERVVALGWGDAETALALGIEPVGASDWLAFGGDGVGPWLEGAYTTPPTIIGTMELDYELIASLKPDLILDVRSSGDQERYDRLSEIATTVGVPVGGEGYLTDSAKQVEMIAKALGKEEEGEALLSSVNDAYAKVLEAYPQFAGKTVAVGAYTSEGWGAYIEGDARVDFMQAIGFVNKAEIEERAVENQFSVSISDEELDILDADLTVIVPIWVDTKEVTDNPLYQQIPSVEDGRVVILDGDYSNAFSAGTVPATLWAVEELPNRFADALNGGE